MVSHSSLQTPLHNELGEDPLVIEVQEEILKGDLGGDSIS
jgi:hypothetical protein